MKKYLMTGIAAVAFCAAFTSCSHDLEPMSQEEINQSKTLELQAKYEAAFIQHFGQPAANQNWGFGPSANKVRTRGEIGTLGMVLKHDEVSNGYPIDREPAPLVEAHDGFKSEKDYVTEWFQNNPGLTPKGLNISNFFIQYVNGDWSNKEGDWHFIDEINHIDKYEKFTANGGMDKLLVGANSTQYVHTNDFNEKNGGPWGVLYVKDGSALQFGYHSSWGEDSQSPDGTGNYWYFKLAKIDVPGVGVGYYVGLSLYGKKAENGVKELGTTRLQYAEDWILKIIPDEPVIEEEEYDGMIIAEDLTIGDAHADFDFNDVVFEYKYVEEGVKIKLLAAGGTLPLCVGDVEVHNEFAKANPTLGITTKTMINTNAGPTVDPVEFTITGTFDPNEYGDDIVIVVNKGTEENPNWIELKAPTGKVASKVRVDTDYEWCSERQDIDDKYFGKDDKRFTKYVTGVGGYVWNTWYKR